jgi:hypothetical protein
MKTTIMTAAAVMAAIPVLAASLRANEEKIHEIGVSTLDHAREHGDWRGCVALLNALPKGTRSEALAAWFRNFSNNKLKLTRDKETASWKCELAKDRDDSDFDIEGADAVTFADFTKEVAPKAMTLTALLKMVEKVANDTTTLPNGVRKVPENVAEVAAQMLATVRAA